MNKTKQQIFKYFLGFRPPSPRKYMSPARILLEAWRLLYFQVVFDDETFESMMDPLHDLYC